MDFFLLDIYIFKRISQRGRLGSLTGFLVASVGFDKLIGILKYSIIFPIIYFRWIGCKLPTLYRVGGILGFGIASAIYFEKRRMLSGEV